MYKGEDDFEVLESADVAEICCNITHRGGVCSGMVFFFSVRCA